VMLVGKAVIPAKTFRYCDPLRPSSPLPWKMWQQC